MARVPAKARRGKTALVLAGGGLTGGIYQLGVLRGLDDLLLNRSTLDFDIYERGERDRDAAALVQGSGGTAPAREGSQPIGTTARQPFTTTAAEEDR